MSAIDFENLDTWPDEFRSLLESEDEQLKGYFDRRDEIEKLQRKDVAARVNPPNNPYKDHRRRVIQRSYSILKGQHLACWHCTRLLDHELHEVRKNGLLPLTPKLVETRLERAVRYGHLTQEIADRLRCQEVSADTSRRDRVCFVNERSILTYEGDVICLLSYWGGEAVYGPIQLDPLLQEVSSIGKATILHCSVPLDDLSLFNEQEDGLDIAERLINRYFVSKGYPVHDIASLETSKRSAMPASMIVEVCQSGDAKFEELTECSNWGARV